MLFSSLEYATFLPIVVVGFFLVRRNSRFDRFGSELSDKSFNDQELTLLRKGDGIRYRLNE